MDAVDGFSVRVETNGHGPVVRVSGELDLATSPRLRTLLGELGDRAVTLDLADVTFLDSSALAVLLWKHKDGGIVLRGVQPFQMKILELCGLRDVFTFDGA